MTPELIQFHAGGLSARTLNAEQFKQLRELIGDDYLMVSRAGDAISVSLNTQKFLAKVPQLGALLMVTSAAPGDGKYFGVVVLGDPTDVSPNTLLSLPDNGELSDNITVLIENVPENNQAGHAFTSFPFFALGELSGTCDESTGKRMWRMSRERPLTVGYYACSPTYDPGTGVVTVPGDLHPVFTLRFAYDDFAIISADSGHTAEIFWNGIDVQTPGGYSCSTGFAYHAKVLLFGDTAAAEDGVLHHVCFTVTEDQIAGRPMGNCHDLVNRAIITAYVKLPSYVYLPPYVPPVTTPPIYVPSPTTPPQIVWIVPGIPPGGGPTPPPYVTIIGGAQDYDDIPVSGSGSITGSTITITLKTKRRPFLNGIAQPISGDGADITFNFGCS